MLDNYSGHRGLVRGLHKYAVKHRVGAEIRGIVRAGENYTQVLREALASGDILDLRQGSSGRSESESDIIRFHDGVVALVFWDLLRHGLQPGLCV